MLIQAYVSIKFWRILRKIEGAMYRIILWFFHNLLWYSTAHFQLDTLLRALTELLNKYFNLLANYLQVL